MTLTKKVLVTGATRGIGRAISQKLLDEGLEVIGVGRNHQDGIEHERYTAETLDLSDLKSLEKSLPELAKRYQDVDAVISNAGRGIFGGLDQFSATQIREAMELNLVSHMVLVRAFLPRLRQRQHADIILMGSEAALRGGKQGSLYCAAKFGLRGFAQALREECVSSGVRVGMIHPGMVRTEFFEELHFEPGAGDDQAILPEDVAEALWTMLSMRRGTVVDELTLSPQKKVIQFKKS
ncbi:MAG: SDR family oxidoreductase [Deltaproteobacteria bacterium]|jgi:3-hydroxy acid dehydrogenase / malonic semialdehyde reductase|nr:SDR family oxidoreductase [Deltaproteobacteria bacterium]MBT6433492.1 SDR family oxidoreductase [Deltaproteobacteria bacterium]MBT6489449.1 SDR family oxidoreductase [Deltaproteobacteria bacterium]